MKLGSAVIGLWSRRSARAYAAMPICDLRRVADLDAERAGRLAAEPVAGQPRHWNRC